MGYAKRGQPQYRRVKARQQPLLPWSTDRIVSRKARLKATGEIVKIVEYGPGVNPRYWVKHTHVATGIERSEFDFL